MVKKKEVCREKDRETYSQLQKQLNSETYDANRNKYSKTEQLGMGVKNRETKRMKQNRRRKKPRTEPKTLLTSLGMDEW